MFGNIGPWELILILAIALIIFGPGKLPEIGNALGRTVREFRNATNNITQEAIGSDLDKVPETTAGNQ